MSKKSTTQKTTENSTTNQQQQEQAQQQQQQQQYSPQYIQDASKYLVNSGTNMISPFLQLGENTIAGFTPDQLAGMDWARNIAGERSDNSYKWYQGARDYVGDATYNPFTAASADAATIDPNRISALMDPFQSAVIDQTTRRLGQDRDGAEARIRAQSAAASPFGGSGEALQLAQLERTHGDTLASTVAGLQSQGYGQAAQLAAQEAQNRQAANLTNAQFAQDARKTNASAWAASEDTRRARGMQGLQMGSSLESEDLQRQLLGLQTLFSTGDAQQAQMQKSLDVPWNMISLLGSLTPKDQSLFTEGQGGSQATSQGTSQTNGTKKTESSGGGSILSGLTGLLSLPMGGGVSLGGSLFGSLGGMFK